MNRSKFRDNRRRGAALVEMAVVAPILVLLVLAIIQYGHLLFVRHNMINAAHQGALVGILSRPYDAGNTEQLIVDSVNTALTESGLGNAGIDIADPEITLEPMFSVTVRVTVPAADVALLGGFLLGDSMTLSSASTMNR